MTRYLSDTLEMFMDDERRAAAEALLAAATGS